MTADLSQKPENRIAELIDTASIMVSKEYLYSLSNYAIHEPVQESPMPSLEEVCRKTRFFHFQKIEYAPHENPLDKLVTILHALYSCNATVAVLIHGDKAKTTYYFGIVSKDGINSIEDQAAVAECTLNGNFQGLNMNLLTQDDIRSIWSSVAQQSYVTAVSGISSLRDQNDKSFEKYVQGLEHLVDSMHGKTYDILVLADPITPDDISTAQNAYAELYTNFSPFHNRVIQHQQSSSTNFSESITKTVTDSLSRSISETHSYTHSHGWSVTNTKGKSRNLNAGALIGGMVGAFAGGVPGAAVGGAIGGLIDMVIGQGRNESTALTENGNEAFGSAKQTGEQKQHAEGTAQGQQVGQTETTGSSEQFTQIHKGIEEFLKKINVSIERLDRGKAFGAFDCAAYVFTDDKETNLAVANSYLSLMRGEQSFLEASYLNQWSREDNIQDYEAVMKYLSAFMHPQFQLPGINEALVTPASVMNSYEVAINLGFPKRSISGMLISETATFGRNAYSVSSEEKKMEIGHIFHLGKEEQIPVNLSIESLTMHTFITGSTGAGKSNYIYNILSSLRKNEKKFLVIEPAKGEYKNVFGGYPDVSVYGTNPMYTELLQINPFYFPPYISVLEHIDRLVEIFNACWPMYAAMPAVLKDAIEQIYRNKGWNFAIPDYYSKVFPTFVDLIHTLPEIMNNSMYSADTKSDYSGALITRVKSLTNGINGTIFCSNSEIKGEDLFDKNVIVDISRVGSSETKALIMGILVMKLQEYRMKPGPMNKKLQHVTVIEEAHNLLRKTSSGQSQESSNLQGKSVEMLTNAIAEMRTYGEGFIISDQAPDLLDEAVIRNTNTKIVLRLPNETDCQLVGKAIALNNDQIHELAKLPAYVAAVYQNDWLEAVLCRSERFEGKKINTFKPRNYKCTIQKFYRRLFGTEDKIEFKAEERIIVNGWIERLDCDDSYKTLLRKALDGIKLSEKKLQALAYALFNGPKVVDNMMKAGDTKSGLQGMEQDIQNILSAEDCALTDRIVKIFKDLICSDEQLDKVAEKYDMELQRREIQ